MQMTIALKVNTPGTDIQGVKESIAMALEPLGDVRVVSVTVETPKEPEQMQFNM